jgi:hypothetical protein
MSGRFNRCCRPHQVGPRVTDLALPTVLASPEFSLPSAAACLGNDATGAGLRFRHDLLEKATGLATAWYLGSHPRRLA